MNSTLLSLMLAREHAADLLREAERERLRRAALGTVAGRGERDRRGFPRANEPVAGRGSRSPWTPRAAG